MISQQNFIAWLGSIPQGTVLARAMGLGIEWSGTVRSVESTL
jgi:hypothetical protein